MEITALNNMIIDASKAIDDNTALFYQQKEKEGYEMLNRTLVLLVESTNELLNSQTDSNKNNVDQEKLNYVLSNAMIAVENGDTILLSDILFFDLKPLLEMCL